MIIVAAGPDEIRAAFTAAIDSTQERVEDLRAISVVLAEAADRYEALAMSPATVERLRAAAAATQDAGAALATADDLLHAALDDFNNRDGAVAEAVTDAANLASAAILTDSTQEGPSMPSDRSAGSSTSTTPAPRRGGYDPNQPRGEDGKWIRVDDVLGYADDDVCYGTDRVTGTGPATTDLALIEYPPEPGVQQGAFVSVATSPHEYNPVTGKETPRDPDQSEQTYAAPQLDPAEAETLARHIEELTGLAESGYRPPEPTKHTRARQQLQHLVDEGHARRRDRISVGEDEDFPLTAGELLKLLEEADPTMSAVQTRRKVRAKAASDAGGEDGTVWVDLESDAAGEPRVIVTAVEGADSPDGEYNRQYASQLTPASARELAGKLRAFAGAARKRKRR